MIPPRHSLADPAIAVRDLTFYYRGKDRPELRDINLEVRRGEILTILGPSGCGKSTLLRNLIGLHQPSSGSVFLNGRDLASLDEEELEKTRQLIGVLFQGGALFGSMTVEENVAMPLVEHWGMDLGLAKRIAQLKLSLVQMRHAAEQFPDELSGGMRKRAALARAIALDPPLLFCDEPSAGLDPLTSVGLDQLILDLNRLFNMTIVVVTHELQSIRKITQRAIMLGKDGRIAACGTMEELENSDNELVQRFLARREPEKLGAKRSWLDERMA